MATYIEMRNLVQDGTMLGKVAIALLIAADAIRSNGAATTEQRAWAGKVLANPAREAERAWPLVLVQNRAFTVAQIQAATDAAIQSAVDGAVALLAAS